MVILVTKENQDIAKEYIIAGDKFTEEVFFPKIRNLNRLESAHKKLEFVRTEKIDGQNIGCQKIGDYLIFYSRNGILELKGLGKALGEVWNKTNWDKVYAALADRDILYFEAIGNHRDFEYKDIFPNGYGLLAFAIKKADGRILDTSKMPEVGMPKVKLIERGPLPSVEKLRKLLSEGREGYVLTAYDEKGNYLGYKAKRRELLEEVPIEEESVILDNNAYKPAEKIAKIICTPAKVKHIMQKLADGIIQIKGSGINEEGKWDGSNAIIATLAKVVQDDCWAESKDRIEQLQQKVGKISGKEINRAIENVVRTAFFDITLKSALS